MQANRDIRIYIFSILVEVVFEDESVECAVVDVGKRESFRPVNNAKTGGC